MIDSMLQRIPNVPGGSAGSVGGVSVAIVDGGDMATVVTALPAELLTAAECRRAAALLLEAADALGSASPAQERDILADLQAAAARKWRGDPAAQRAGLFARAAAEIERLRELLRVVSDEPNIDRARAIADAALHGANASLTGRRRRSG